jgi:glyoxylate reductase
VPVEEAVMTGIRAFVTCPLPEGSLEPLVGAGFDVVVREAPGPARADELAAALQSGMDGLVSVITDRIDAAALAAGAGRLRVVANVAVGYDNIDVPAATAAGVVVCNTPGVLDETTADLAFSLILAASRRCSGAEADLRQGRWGDWDISGYLGRDVHGATLGIVGYGRIGRAVARRAAGFSMTVLHHTRRPTGDPGWVGDLDELLARSDIVTLHVPLSDATRHLIGRRELALMPPHAVLVNTARGPVVDEDALAEALESGRLFAAGLDVFDGEPRVNPRLLAAPHTVLLPHIGSATIRTRTEMATMACRSVAQVLSGSMPPNALNPEAHS